MAATLLIVLLAGAAFYLGWRRALAKSGGSIASLHSKPGHYAWYVALLCAGPALALWLAWVLFGDLVLRWVVAGRLRVEHVDIDAARPQHDVAESRRFEVVLHGRCRHHYARCGRMEPSQHRVGP